MSSEATLREHRRPARTDRARKYPPFAATGPKEPISGTKPIYLYLRLSKYHRDGRDAIERQRLDLTRKLAAEGGWTVMGEYIDNDSASASAQRTRRGWRALTSDIEAGRVRAVAFWKLDRTNRIASQCIEWIAECQRLGVFLVSHQDAADELNTATAGAKLITGIKALLAEVETDSMSERQRAAKRHASEAGFFHGGTRPLGWMSGPRVTDEHGRSGVRLVPHPVEFPALKDAAAMVLAGQSTMDISRYWKDRYGICTAHGTQLYEATVHRALISPRMVGYRMRQVPEHQRGITLDLLQYIARDHDGNPVISQEPVCDLVTWMRVRRMLERGATSGVRRPWGSHPWLLTGLAYCQCGERLYGHSKTRITRGEKHHDFVYRCLANRLRGAGSCARACSIRAEPAEAYVEGWFFAQLDDEALSKARVNRAQSRTDHQVRSLLEQIEQARIERDALVNRQGSSEFSGGMVTVLLDLIENVDRRIGVLQRDLDALTPLPFRDDSRRTLEQAWPTLGIVEKRRLLRGLIRRVDLLPGRGPASDRVLILAAF